MTTGFRRKHLRAFSKLAATDSDASVRSQLASTAKRLPAADALPIVSNILSRSLDEQDPFIPLLLWWAVEQHSVTSMDRVLKAFATREAWSQPMIRHVIMKNLMRRYAAEGTVPAYAACAQLLATAPDDWQAHMLEALDMGLQERLASPTNQEANMAAVLQKQLAALERTAGDKLNPALIAASARLGSATARQRALEFALRSGASVENRAAMIRLSGELGDTAAIAPCLQLIQADEPAAVKEAALDTLRNFNDDRITPALLQLYPKAGALQPKIRTVLLSRSNWALAFLQEVDQGRFATADVGQEELRPLAAYHNHQIDDLIAKYWGRISGGTPEEKLNEIRRIKNDLRAEAGDPTRGRELFRKTCEACHQLYGEGTAVGPNLTHANRQDQDFLLESIVDPSAVIRKEFLNYTVETKDGRTLSGLIADQSPASVTLLGAGGVRSVVNRSGIASMTESQISLMPEGLLAAFKPQELRDLFTYLQSTAPPSGTAHASINQ